VLIRETISDLDFGKNLIAKTTKGNFPNIKEIEAEDVTPT